MTRSALFHFALGGLLLAATPITPRAHAGSTPIQDALELGSDYLVSIQSTYPGSIRINPGPPGAVANVQAIPNVWEFDIGAGFAYFNTWGASARGVLAAAVLTNSRPQLASALRYANDLVADFNDSGNFARSDTRPMAVDLELLGILGAGPRRSCDGLRGPHLPTPVRGPYAATAAAWHLNNLPGAAEADRIINGRVAQGNGDLAGWDVALAIRGALAAGDTPWACAAAEQVVARRGDWEGSSPAYISDYWHSASEGGLAYALSLVAGVAGSACSAFEAGIRDYRDQLLARVSGPNVSPYTGIDADGAIGTVYAGDTYYPTQQNAFALLGLLGCGKQDATSEDVAAATGIAAYLLRAQYPAGTGPAIQTPSPDPRPADGGWPGFPYYYTDDSNAEINGEALTALALAHERGLKPSAPPMLKGATPGAWKHNTARPPFAGSPEVMSQRGQTNQRAR